MQIESYLQSCAVISLRFGIWQLGLLVDPPTTDYDIPVVEDDRLPGRDGWLRSLERHLRAAIG